MFRKERDAASAAAAAATGTGRGEGRIPAATSSSSSKSEKMKHMKGEGGVKWSREDKEYPIDEEWLLETFPGVVDAEEVSDVLAKLQAIQKRLKVGGLIELGLNEGEKHRMKDAEIPPLVRDRVERYAKERNSVAGLGDGTKNVKDYAEADVVIGECMKLSFTPNKLVEDEATHRRLLGDLYDPRYEWPIHGGLIDMRLFSREDMVLPTTVHDEEMLHEEEEAIRDASRDRDRMRPTARQLSDRIEASPSSAVFAMIGVSGAGKTSCGFDLAHEHFTIYVRAAGEDDRVLKVGSSSSSKSEIRMRRTSEQDALFARLKEDVQKFLSQTKSETGEQRVKAWDVAAHRSAVDLTARLLTLARMYEYCKPQNKVLHPRAFLIHQIAGEQQFTLDVVKILRLYNLSALQWICGCLRQKWLNQLIPASKPIVLIIDEIQAAARIGRSSFQRELDVPKLSKGLLSPLAHAAEVHLRAHAKWSIVFMGTGMSMDSLNTLATDIGKTNAADFNTYQPSDFPSVEVLDVIGILGRLNLAALGLSNLFEGPLLQKRALSEPVCKDAGSHAEALRNFLEDYVIGSRFRVLAAVIEQIGRITAPNDWRKLYEAMQASVTEHKAGVTRIVQQRIGPKVDPDMKSTIGIDDLESALLGALLTDGQSFLGMNSDVNGDLVELGIATESVMIIIPPTRYQYQRIRERFVTEVLTELLAKEEWAGAVIVARVKKNVKLLKTLLDQLGSSAPSKGNVFERILLEKLAGLGGPDCNVAALPFLEPFLTQDQKATWSKVKYGKRRVSFAVSGAPQGQDTISILNSEQALELVWSPENAMRPDGVAMLGKAEGLDGAETPRRALVLASALYSNKVAGDKMDDQLYSADLSYSYLSKSGKMYKAVKKRRERWCQVGLHKTICIRILVALPFGEFTDILPSKMATAEATREYLPKEKDIVVVLDKTNIHLLLGANKELYELLAIATRTQSADWPGSAF